MIPFSYLALEEIDNTGAIVGVAELTDTIRYALTSYAPTIAPRLASTIVGGTRYDIVDDTIALAVLGDTATACIENYLRLLGMLTQAGRWWDGEQVNPVRLSATVQNGSGTRWSAILLGAAGGAPPASVTPDLVVQAGGGYAMPGVEIGVRRRGRWLTDLLNSDIDTSTSNPEIQTLLTGAGAADSVLFTDAPAAVVVRNVAGLGNEIGYLLVAQAATALKLTDASAATASGYTTVTNAAAFPYQGTNVLRYTPTGTTFAASGAILSNSLTSNYQVWSVFAAVRNNSASASFQLRAAIVPEGSTGVQGPTIRTTPIVVETDTTDPQIVPLGLFSLNAARFDLTLEIATSTISGSPTFDISYLALIALDAPAARVTRIDPNSAVAPDGRIVLSAELLNQRIGEVRPISSFAGGAQYAVTTSYGGDVELIVPGVRAITETVSLVTLYLETEGTAWTLNNAGAKIPLIVEVLFRAASLVPR